LRTSTLALLMVSFFSCRGTNSATTKDALDAESSVANLVRTFENINFSGNSSPDPQALNKLNSILAKYEVPNHINNKLRGFTEQSESAHVLVKIDKVSIELKKVDPGLAEGQLKIPFSLDDLVICKVNVGISVVEPVKRISGLKPNEIVRQKWNGVSEIWSFNVRKMTDSRDGMWLGEPLPRDCLIDANALPFSLALTKALEQILVKEPK
jgi:hypothetical protein